GCPGASGGQLSPGSPNFFIPFTCGGQKGTFFPFCHCTAIPVYLPRPQTGSCDLSNSRMAPVPTYISFSITGTSLSAWVVPAFSMAIFSKSIASYVPAL